MVGPPRGFSKKNRGPPKKVPPLNPGPLFGGPPHPTRGSLPPLKETPEGPLNQRDPPPKIIKRDPVPPRSPSHPVSQCRAHLYGPPQKGPQRGKLENQKGGKNRGAPLPPKSNREPPLKPGRISPIEVRYPPKFPKYPQIARTAY